MDKAFQCLAAAAMVVLLGSPAGALINPNYTPIELVNHAKTVVRLEVAADGKGVLIVSGVRALKGDAPAKLALVVDRASPKAARDLADALGGSAKPAVLFLGDFSAAREAAAAGGDGKPLGAMQIGLTWFALKAAGDQLELSEDKLDIKTVWAGSAAMLERVIDYVGNDSRAEVPVKVGVQWGGDEKLGEVKGRAHACLAVPLWEPRRPSLLVLADAGDRLFRAGDDGKMADVTAQVGLTTRSRSAVCGDFNGDGRADLACTDGRGITLLLMGADGKLEAKPLDYRPTGECIGLAAIGLGAGNGLLVSAAGAADLLSPGREGKFTAVRLAGPPDGAGAARPGLAADFDGDGICDVLQVRAEGVWFCKGGGDGRLAAPALACKVALGEGSAAPLAGDFDADGLLDVLVPRKRACALLANLGGGKFLDVLREAGEVDYNSGASETVAAAWCDLNNDGRQEFVLLSPNVGFQPYFNRGFRCFGYAPEIDADTTTLKGAEAARQGQQAGVMGDFNGDGAQDLALVTAGGQIWVFWRDASRGSKLAATVLPPPGVSGPVSVIGYDGSRCLGAQPVSAGRAGFFCRRSKGPIRLEWQIEPGRRQTGQVPVLQPTQFQLPAKGADGARVE
jgi:hypothetical protein